MKKLKKLTIIICTVLILLASMEKLQAQTIADFEYPALTADTFWNGSDGTGGFYNGNAWFTNTFTDWGGGFTSWSGFAYSNMQDTVTQNYSNEFSAITAFGYDNSQQYAVVYVSSYDPLPRIRLSGIAPGDTVSGFFVTNSAFGYLTMKNGDGIAKKFGGLSGYDPDWFALAVYGYYNGIKKPDSVVFYMADFRFSNSAQDYLVNNWQWVDLKSLGKVDSLEFNMFSSDTGSFGINTPTYFCMDNLITNHNSLGGIFDSKQPVFSLYPNPAEDFIMFRNNNTLKEVRIFDIHGKIKMSCQTFYSKIDIRGLLQGVYLLEVVENDTVFYSKFVKK